VKTYKIVEGYIQINFTETGEILPHAEKFPVSRFSMIVDLRDEEVVDYLLNHLGITTRGFIELDEAPLFMDYQLN
jgi:hypothetical protein